MRPDDRLDRLEEFEIDPTPIWPEDDGRLEPIFLAGLLGTALDDLDPPLLFLPQQELQQPQAAGLDTLAFAGAGVASEVPQSSLPPRRRLWAASLFGSLGVHLLPLLLLLSWQDARGGVPASIPVQLVIQQPAPAATAAEVASATAPPPKPAEPAAPPHPEPPVVRRAAPPPRPAPPQHVAKAASPRRVSNPPAPEASTAGSAHRPAAAEARSPTPAKEAPGRLAMTRDQYLAYLVALTWQHVDLLPATFISGRQGQTELLIRVLSDGTIAHIGILQSSGYPDIDGRIEEMVTAIGRFPPLPPSFSGPSAELNMVLRFPQVLQR